LAPSNPASSAVVAMNNTDRFGGGFIFMKAAASSMTEATPDALSIAPLKI
jgi:hypothetical protein